MIDAVECNRAASELQHGSVWLARHFTEKDFVDL